MSEQNNTVLMGDIRGGNTFRLVCVQFKAVNFLVNCTSECRRYQ